MAKPAPGGTLLHRLAGRHVRQGQGRRPGHQSMRVQYSGHQCGGRKDLLGMYVSESEGANFWLGVLTHLQQRGVTDILIACIDNLKGFAEAIATIYPTTEVQPCVVHQIRNSIKYVASKDQKAFMADLKPVYQATSKDEAEQKLAGLEEKWARNIRSLSIPGSETGTSSAPIFSIQLLSAR
jgi:transposase-like protein